jgi:uncharacterized repeat protein (TIGR03803 family)
MHSAVTSSLTKRLTPIFQTAVRSALTLAILSALLVVATARLQAQTESVLYSFAGKPDGSNPRSPLVFNGGNLYGTTYSGGLYGFGTVFELTPTGTGGWTEKILYNFCPASPSCTDGENPTFAKLLFDSAGNIYGTAYAGGALGNGAVFELSPLGSSWNYQVLYSFTGQPDAANPINGLVMDASGNIYGTAYAGGGGNNGAIFQLHPTGTGTWTEQVIANVSEIFAGLAIDSSGDLYGTTAGSVFKIIPNGVNNWYLANILTFTTSATQGSTPNGTPILDSVGNLYGTTTNGGKNNLGVVYKLVKNGNLKYTERVLYNFGPNGTLPYAGLVMDSAGNLYGTTTAGGKNGAGIVYELVSSGTGYFTERPLQAFLGINGAVPYDSLILDSGNYLYGTTYGGGTNGQGTVFVVNPHAAVTSTTVASSLNPSKSGQAVTFTATVTSSSGPPPDGEVVVFQPLGQSTMKGGVATYTTSAMATGTTVVHALYNGDLNFTVSKSAPLSQVVQP